MVYILGPAGSGKSTFTAGFRDWLKSQEVPVMTFNLDPAVEELSYLPDIDVREYVFTRNIMEKYHLGPNGAIIASMDMVLEYLGYMEKEVQQMEEGYVLVDTPGQMEIFVFRKSGEFIVKSLCSQGRVCAVIFMMDPLITSSPSDLISQLFMAASVFYRLKFPLLGVFSKIDLLSEEERIKIQTWISNASQLERDIEFLDKDILRDFSRKIFRSIIEFKEYFPIILSSSKTFEGYDEVYRFLQQIYRGGEDFERTTSLVEK